MQHITIVEFEEKHVEDAAKVLTRSFLTMNRAWKHYNLPFDDIYRFMRGKIIPALQSLMTFVILEKDKLIGISISYDMLKCIKMPNMPMNIQFFKKLAAVGTKLEQSLNLSQFKQGDIIYGLYAVIDPDYANKGYSLPFWWQCLSVGKVAGWKYYYSRISSPISLKMVLKLGYEVVSEVEFVDGDLKQKFWMVRLDFSKPFPSYSMLKAMTQKKKQPTAKL